MSDWVSAYYKAYDGAESVLWVSSVLSTSMLKLSYAGRRQNNDSSETFWQISAVFIILTLWPGPMTSEAAAISLKMGLIVSRLLLNEVNAQSIFALLKCHTARLCLFCMPPRCKTTLFSTSTGNLICSGCVCVCVCPFYMRVGNVCQGQDMVCVWRCLALTMNIRWGRNKVAEN